MVTGYRATGYLRRIAAGLVILLTLGAAVAVPPAAAQRLAPPLTSTDAILKWINSYRHKPDPESLPAVVHTLSAMQAFKDAESSGPYIGFIAGVLGANGRIAENLTLRMISIDPADHWVLVRAIAYSGLSNWKDLLATFVDRMPTRREMINKYLDGKLPTLEQIDFQTVKPGMLERIKDDLHIGDRPKKPVALQPTPELIDVLWGYYLATGTYAPIASVIKLLPLSNDHDNVDNLTTGSAAKFTLASNAVRDTDLLAMLQEAESRQPDDVKPVLKDVIETAETVDTVHMRQESLAAIQELKEKGPASKRELSGWGQVGQGALSMGCVVAAATGQIELGIPCVIGGAAYTAGLQYATH